MEYEYFTTDVKFGNASRREIERVLNDDAIDPAWEFVCFTPAGHGVYRMEKV